MSAVLPIICLARHGETAWSLSGQHTGLTDLPLTERGELNAQSLGRRLRGITFAKVFTSPLKRAVRTCELAGFGGKAESDRHLLEWNYGQYEGRRTREIHEQRPGGNCFATVVLEEKHRIRSAPGPIASWTALATSRATSCCFRAGISSGF